MPESRQRFLVIRLSSIGDIVHTLPAVAALGRAHPQAEIHWAIEDRFAALIETNPFVSRIIRLDTLTWRKNATSGQTMAEIMKGIGAIREFTFDAVIDFQGLMKSAIFARLSHSQQRIGLASKWLREPLAAMLYTHRISPRNSTHIIEINLSLVEPLGAHASKWEFPLPENPADVEAVQQRLQSLGTQDFIIINPGGGWKSKRWPPACYAELAAGLVARTPLEILVTGSQQEEALAQEIITRAGTPRAKWFPSTLLQFIALARRAKLLIGGDTGPLHLAAAVGTPIVAIFNSTDPRNTPERNGPFNPEDIVLASPGKPGRTAQSKHMDYLDGVSVEAVLNGALQRLAKAYEK